MAASGDDVSVGVALGAVVVSKWPRQAEWLLRWWITHGMVHLKTPVECNSG